MGQRSRRKHVRESNCFICEKGDSLFKSIQEKRPFFKVFYHNIQNWERLTAEEKVRN